ncbi:roadblock/LC7 domain-containing protein [Umezawaea sp. Da 62-37]|uniref:roadblock/LC7 domain-containing protein n=1 Tax=Umezawaea sp. Da 62-37 TaxID=3075927 RepID=UPI0028F709A7|nr:roadblock/LC7 domain-containing protein [Umezawaea sp. Da 62-37]WNV84671.1 roadblock/LC7 domain-containing protein [Umezawaea sp. Da 62-37]
MTQPPFDREELATTLRAIRDQIDRVTGLLVATRDGLVLSSDTDGVAVESVAAMAAATVGLAAQFTSQANIGQPRTAVFEGESGYVCVFPVESSLLLVVFGEKGITHGLFNIAARQALSMIRHVVLNQRVQTVRANRRSYYSQPES